MIDFKSTVISWNSFKSNFKNCFTIDFSTIESLLDQLSNRGSTINWKKLKNWEDMDDIDIFKELPGLEKISGDMYMVTEASYKKDLGPFQTLAADLELFIAGHLNAYGECFFNGDVIIISTNNNCMWIFHHAGVMTFINDIS